MFTEKSFLFALIILLSFNVFAQNADEAIKEKRERQSKLLEQIIEDAKNLRLPENRAVIYAKAGSAIWKQDEKQARKFFKDALGELIIAQTEAQNEKGAKTYLQSLIYGQSPRLEIVNMVSARDPELALEYLVKSRPTALAGALEGAGDENSLLQQYARAEVANEQRLIGMVAEQKPELAVRRIRESIKRGVTYETLNILKKLYAKDALTGDKLAAEIFESFLNTDVTKNYLTAEAVGYFISEFGRPLGKDEKAVRVPEDLLRRLVLKISDDWLKPNNTQLYGYWNSASMLERFFPERAAKIKKKLPAYSSQSDESQDYSRLMASEVKPEEMLAQAEKFSSSYRREIYRSAAQKFANAGNFAQAEEIMLEKIKGEQAEYYLSNFYVNLANQLAGQGRFDAANDYINRIADEYQRINALINLANIVWAKNPKENQNLAEGILAQALALIPNPPETQNEFTAAISLASAYARFDAGESFRLIESLLPTLNELIQANFVMFRFRNYGGLRQNEFIIINSSSNLGFYGLETTLNALKEKDFERALQITDGINRADIRIWLKMQLLDDNLSNIAELPVNTRPMMILRN